MKQFVSQKTNFVFIVATFLACLHTLSAAPTYTLTLTVPNGTTQHGNPHIFCLPPSTVDYIIFFSSNFFSHAATVINRPGASTAEKGLLIALAVLFPGIGILRAYDVFVRFISWRSIKSLWSILLHPRLCSKMKNSTSQQDTSQNIAREKLDDAALAYRTTPVLHYAGRAGALIAIVRSKGWKPRRGELQKIPRVVCTEAENKNNGSASSDQKMKGSTNTCLVEIIEQDLLKPTVPTAIRSSFSKVSAKAKIHGHIVMKQEFWNEYHLQILPPDTIVEPPPYPSSWPPLQTGEPESVPNQRTDKNDKQHFASPTAHEPTQTGESSQAQILRNNAAALELDVANESRSRQSTQGPANASEQVMDDYESFKSLKLACTRSTPKIVLSVLQLVFGISTLVRSTGEEQIQEFGYSAFSLAIAPYIFMSLINLIANLRCPQYPNLFLVRTCAMDEIELRMGKDGKTKRAFFGVVGRVCVNEQKSDLPADFIYPGEDAKDSQRSDSGNAESTRKYTAWENLELYQKTPPKSAWAFPPWRNSSRGGELIKVQLDDNEKRVSKTLSSEKSCDLTLEVPECEKFWTYERSNWKYTLFAIRSFFLFFLIASPLAIDGAFSKFRTGPGSKIWERGFIQAWLWVGQVGGVGLGLWIPYVFRRWEKWDDIRKEKLQLLLLVSITVLIASPAVGGYFAVWRMLKNYGNCTRLF